MSKHASTLFDFSKARHLESKTKCVNGIVGSADELSQRMESRAGTPERFLVQDTQR